MRLRLAEIEVMSSRDNSYWNIAYGAAGVWGGMSNDRLMVVTVDRFV